MAEGGVDKNNLIFPEQQDKSFDNDVHKLNVDYHQVEEFLRNINKEYNDEQMKDRIAEIKKNIINTIAGNEVKVEKEYESKETESNQNSSSESEERKQVKKKIKKIQKKKYVKTSESSNSSDESQRNHRKSTENEIMILKEVIKRLDNRKVPDLENFDENTGEDIEEYLKRFEEHYEETYRGGKHLRVRTLEKYLNGKTLETYRALKQNDDNYKDMKKKLIKWYREEEENRKSSAKRKFEKAKMKSNESTIMYSNRLLQMYKIAYGNRKYETSNTLINKFVSTVDKQLRKMIKSQMFSAKMNDKIMTWEKIQKCSRLYDAEKDDQKEEKLSSEDEDEVVVINFSESKPQQKQQQQPAQSYNYYNSSSHHSNKNYHNNHDKEWHMHYNSYKPVFKYNCNFCGKKGHKEVDCRKKSGACFLCGRKNHYAKDCREKEREAPFQHEIQNRDHLNYQTPAGTRPSWRK